MIMEEKSVSYNDKKIMNAEKTSITETKNEGLISSNIESLENKTIYPVQEDNENSEIVREPSEQYSMFNKNEKMNYYSKYKDKKIDQLQKGHLLEYRLKRLIFHMGYYPKTGIIIKTTQDEQADMITDLDVFGVYIHRNFTSKAIWVDCKSGQAKPLERITWINGVKNSIQIDDIIFVKKGVRQSTKQFARKLGIQILDLDIIERLEKDYAIEQNDWRGSWNPVTQSGQLLRLQSIKILDNDTMKKIRNFISSDYWTYDTYTKVKKSITALRQISEIEQLPLTKEQIHSINWTTFELINLFVLASLNISKEVYYFSDIEKKDTISDGLISGEISSKKRTEIVEATYKIAYSIIQKQIPDFNAPLQIPSIGLNPPKYFEAFYDLVQRITSNPHKYFDILRFLDYVFMEYDLNSKKIDETFLRKIFLNFDDLILSGKTILHFICSITGISKEKFQLLS